MGRVSQVSDAADVNPFRVTYTPSGSLQTITQPNGITRYFAYNSRLQPVEITDVDTAHGYGCGSQPTRYQNSQLTKWDLDLQLFWGNKSDQVTKNNGSLWSQVIQTCSGTNLSTAANFTQSYAYDTLNRIAQVQDTGGNSARTFGYDPYGNMWARTTGSFPSNPETPTGLSSFNESTNQLVSSLTSYDGAGNQLGLPGFCSNCMQYDAENRLIAYTPTTTTYAYDGLGHRVQKTTNGVATTYLYDVFGRMMAEYTSGTVATLPCSPCYLSTDHLGSTRMVTDQNGALVSRHDFLPFGEEIPGGYAGRPATPFGNADGVDQKFTGQVRDSESNSDYFNARYFAALMGRFTSPDPGNAGADPSNPQSWNAYSSVWNNPLSAVDPTGNCTVGNDGAARDDAPGDCGGGSTTVNGGSTDTIATDPAFYTGGLLSNALFSATVYGRPPAPPQMPGNPPKTGTNKPGYCNVSGSSSIVTLTATKALTEVGAFIGSAFGPEGTLAGAVIGSQFGAGGNISYVNATHSAYIGVTGVFAPAQIGGGGGFSLSYTPVPATQNANSIANGTSYGVAFQANPLLGSTVSKSPGSGPPVVGFQVGTRSPVSFSASHNICLLHCGC